jgi:hypothetical protein
MQIKRGSMPSIRPQYLTFGDLINKRLFRIPDYQRAYSWGSQQRQELFEDVRKTSRKSGTEHYMATVVTLSRTTKLIGTDEHQIAEIVDGQQRITTLILLLKAIAKALNSKVRIEARSASELSDILVKPESDTLLLLQTNHDTSHIFATYLRTGVHPKPISVKTLADRELLRAMQECEEFVETWKSNKSLIELLALLKNRLAFVMHEIEDESAAYTTFEVLNSRGLEVSYLDRLKSSLMGTAFELQAGNKMEVIEELHRIWADIYRCIGFRQGMDTEALKFAATLWASKSPSKPLGEKDAVKTLHGDATTAPKIVAVAKWILDVTQACDLLKGNRRLNAVTRIDQARLVAAALNLRHDLKDEDRKKLLRLWENVTFRIYGMYDKDARTGVGDYVRLAWSIVKEKLPVKAITRALQGIGADFPIEDAVKELRNSNCYESWAEELRYFMYRYEEYLSREQKQKFSSEQWERIWEATAADSIEHIWAQSKAPVTQVHRLGNLVLLPPKLNSQLKDIEPKAKRDAYTRTGLLIAQQAAQKLNTWNKKSIDDREKSLLNWATSEWGD